MILKVKEPQPPEYERFREGQILFTYLHLAADDALTRFLAERTVAGGRVRDRPVARRPPAAPRTDVRDRRPHGSALRGEQPGAAQGRARGADRRCLGRQRRRTSSCWAPGMAGTNAAWIAAGMEAEVTIVDKNVERLRFVDQIWRGTDPDGDVAAGSRSSGW